MIYPVTSIAIVSIVLAAAETTEWWHPLMNVGIIGPVLIWFMLRAEKKWDEQGRIQKLQAEALANNTHGMMTVECSTHFFTSRHCRTERINK